MNLSLLKEPSISTCDIKNGASNCIPARCDDFVTNCTKCNCISFPFYPEICSSRADPNYLPCFSDKDMFTIECKECAHGTFLDTAGICIWCGEYINNCNSCRQLKDGTVVCDVCDYGYAISWFDKAECINCRIQIPNCLACLPSKVPMEYICSQCIDNYVSIDDGSCISCSDEFPNCKECVMEKLSPRCKRCNFGYGLIEASVATSKKDTCKLCHTVVPYCTVCIFETETSMTCLACNEGMQMIAKNVCEDCAKIDTYCTMCTNSPNPTCTACKSGMTFIDGKCKSCQSISGGCKKCVYAPKPYCTECISGFYLTGSNTGQTCILCAIQIKECAECSFQAGSVICTVCKDGYHLTKSNTCEKIQQNLPGCKKYSIDSCNECIDGYVLIKNVCVFCRVQSLGCARCKTINNDLQCTECIHGYYLKNGKCFACSKAIPNCRTCVPATAAVTTTQEATCTSCAITYYLDVDRNVCEIVIPNCVYFFKEQDRVQCQRCLDNYKLTRSDLGDSVCVHITSEKTGVWFHVWIMVALFFSLMLLSFLPIYLKKCLIAKKHALPLDTCDSAPKDKQH